MFGILPSSDTSLSKLHKILLYYVILTTNCIYLIKEYYTGFFIPCHLEEFSHHSSSLKQRKTNHFNPSNRSNDLLNNFQLCCFSTDLRPVEINLDLEIRKSQESINKAKPYPLKATFSVKSSCLLYNSNHHYDKKNLVGKKPGSVQGKLTMTCR